MDWHIVYAKFDGCKGFKAFDVNEGRQVGNLIYASLMENTEDTRQKLQKLADLNKEYHLVYKRLLEKHEALNNLTDEVLDTRRERFIQEVINHYDMVEIGTLYFGDMAIDVESIYYDKAEHRLMVHISSKEMEGDIIYTSLQREKQGKLVELVFEEMKCLEEGPTLLGMMIDGSNILYRNVFIKELNAEVKVTTEEVFEAHIEEGSPDEDKFYCYVPAEEFFKLNDIDFEKYVNKNF